MWGAEPELGRVVKGDGSVAFIKIVRTGKWLAFRAESFKHCRPRFPSNLRHL